MYKKIENYELETLSETYERISYCYDSTKVDGDMGTVSLYLDNFKLSGGKTMHTINIFFYEG